MASSAPDKLFPNQRGFPTPNAAPDTSGCRVFTVPADEEYYALLMGALDALRLPKNWYQNGTMTQDEAAAAFSDILDAAYALAELGTCDAQIQTPWWDTPGDVDDDAPADTQPWYGLLTVVP